MTEKLSAEEVAAVKSIGIGHSYMPDKNARSRLRRMGLIESVPSSGVIASCHTGSRIRASKRLTE